MNQFLPEAPPAFVIAIAVKSIPFVFLESKYLHENLIEIGEAVSS